MTIKKTSIKTPSNDVCPVHDNPTNRGSGIFGGEPGYKSRTPTPNGPKEKIYDVIAPGTSPSIRSPAIPAAGK